MTLNLIMNPEMITVYSYLIVSIMAVGFIPWLRLNDLVRLIAVSPMFFYLINL